MGTVAYCGLLCDTCTVLLATREQDEDLQQVMRESIAGQCANLYGINLQPEDITDCDGCRADAGRLFPGCLNCGIRACARMKNVENCAYYSDYACELLRRNFLLEPEVKERLDKIRMDQIPRERPS